MHTYFTVLCGGKADISFNAVSADYPSAFGEGNLFSEIKTGISRGGENSFVLLPANHVSTEYLGDGIACMTYSAEAEFQAGTNINTLSFVSESGRVINTASLPSPESAEGKAEIIARAFVEISGSDVIFSNRPEPLFDILFGGAMQPLKAMPANRTRPAFKEENAIPVTMERGEVNCVLSVDTGAPVNSEYIAFFAGKQHIFSMRAGSVSPVSEGALIVGHTVTPVAFGKEISVNAGSALTASEATARDVPASVGEAQGVLLPFGFSNARSNEDGSLIALKCNGFFTLIKKTDNGYVPLDPFAESLKFSSPRDFAVCGENLFVLDSDLHVINSSDLSDTVYALSAPFDKVFAFSESEAALCGSGGISLYYLSDSLVSEGSVPIANALYGFDRVSGTLTAVTIGGVTQMRIAGGSVETKSFPTPVNTDGITAVCGRWGRAALVYTRSVCHLDLFAQSLIFRTFRGNGMKADASGTVFVNNTDTGCGVYRFDEDYVQIGSVSSSGTFMPTEAGIISTSGEIYPFDRFAVRWELLTGEVSPNGYSVYKEVPYFAEDSIILSFEASV